MSEGECLICRTAAEREHQAVFANGSWRASLSANQGYVGTLFIELLDHKSSLAELTATEWSDYASLVRIIQAAETAAFGARTFTWSSSLDTFFKHHPPLPHVFWHVRPRYDHEIVIAGRAIRDPNFGEQYDKDHFVHVSPDLKASIVQRLKRAINNSGHPDPAGRSSEPPHPAANGAGRPNPK